MTWFKVDDQFYSHPKAVAAGNAACGLWVRAGTWSAAQLTDGHIPAAMLPILGARLADARRLVHAQLWHEHGHTCERCPQAERGGYVFHEWGDHQPTREQILLKREARAAAGRIGGKASGRSRREAKPKQDASLVVEPPARPGPTNAAAAASGGGSGHASLPPDIAVFASKMRAHTALSGLTWDDIPAGSFEQIQALIAQHGDDVLLEWALRTVRQRPPAYPSAFIKTWQAIGAPKVVPPIEPVCSICGRTQRKCEAVNNKLADPEAGHEFQEAS